MYGLKNAWWTKYKKYIMAFIPVLAFAWMILGLPFYSLEARWSDFLYTRLQGTDRKIKMITVDEETLNEYGTFVEWSRGKCADLITLLYQDKDMSPAVVGVDFLYVSEFQDEEDRRLVEACQNAENVIFASNLVYRGTTKTDEEGMRYYDSWNVDIVEEPYDTLSAYVTAGFANVYIAEDGCVRYAKLAETVNNETKYSFAYEIYKEYMEKTGRAVKIPQSDNKGKFTFFYSGENGEYAYFSMKDVLSGKVPVSEFKDDIVLVGAYAPGFQDAYVAAVKRGTPMYGVEIHANIIQALMDGKTAVAVPYGLYLAICVLVIFSYFVIAGKQKLFPALAEAAILILVHIVSGKLLAQNGYTIPQLYFLVIFICIAIYFIIEKYIGERLRRKKVLATFKKYVAPQIVDKLSKEGGFELKLGGEKRNIAVLFVDIRGFTPMSESLKPEEVVGILNQYLALTTTSIFNHQGTLDKYIGDATMAVFNAPFDLEDYVYKAVLTAIAIREGSDKLAKDLQERFGKTISYGIGVNMGEAVVGNIGCEFRMDYTAIGDTVNTAARLESRAKAGEILISEMVYQEIKERIKAEFVGVMELKGKSIPVNVYRVLDKKE